MTHVLIPSQLTSYTGGATRVEAAGATVGAVLDEQDGVRRHMRLFVGCEETRSLAAPLGVGDELLIFGALSGG